MHLVNKIGILCKSLLIVLVAFTSFIVAICLVEHILSVTTGLVNVFNDDYETTYCDFIVEII